MTALPSPSTVLATGIHDGVPAELYHRDPCPEPSLSASVAKLLLERSPAHARLAHPRLNAERVDERKAEFDLGSAVHALVLERNERGIEPLDFDNYRTKAAQDARDAAYNAGKTPLLPHQVTLVRDIAASVEAQLANHREAQDAFNPILGRPEQTLVWQEDNGIWCRARVDWLPFGRQNVVYDLKTEAQSANPEDWSRSLYDKGYHITAAHYRRGLRKLLGREFHYRFVVVEKEPPYALSVCELAPDALHHADREAERAVNLWGRCLSRNWWPGYVGQVAGIDMPPWIERRITDRHLREELARDGGRDLLDEMTAWQAPLPAPTKEAA